jgi:hypothetical protein
VAVSLSYRRVKRTSRRTTATTVIVKCLTFYLFQSNPIQIRRVSNRVAKKKQQQQSTSTTTQQMQHVVHCQTCARKRSHLLDNFVMLNQYSMEELKLVYDQFQLCLPNVQPLLNEINSTTNAIDTNNGLSNLNSLGMDYENNLLATNVTTSQQQQMMMMMIN